MRDEDKDFYDSAACKDVERNKKLQNTEQCSAKLSNNQIQATQEKKTMLT